MFVSIIYFLFIWFITGNILKSPHTTRNVRFHHIFFIYLIYHWEHTKITTHNPQCSFPSYIFYLFDLSLGTYSNHHTQPTMFVSIIYFLFIWFITGNTLKSPHTTRNVRFHHIFFIYLIYHWEHTKITTHNPQCSFPSYIFYLFDLSLGTY